MTEDEKMNKLEEALKTPEFCKKLGNAISEEVYKEILKNRDREDLRMFLPVNHLQVSVKSLPEV
jgi:hypothetical protein